MDKKVQVFPASNSSKVNVIVPLQFEFAYFIAVVQSLCCILTFDPAQNAIQGDAPEESDTFQWQLGEEITWAEIG